MVSPWAQALTFMSRFLSAFYLAWPTSPSAVDGLGASDGFCQRPDDCNMEDAETYVHMIQRDLALQASSSNSEVASFLWLTDAHIDPYYLSADRQCKKKALVELQQYPFGSMGCDPPPSLLYSILEGAAAWLEKVAGKASFMLFTGDFARHGPGRMRDSADNASDIVKNVSILARDFFPDLPAVFGTLGNDDSPCDYCENITTASPVNPWFWRVGTKINQANCMTDATLEMYKYGSYFDITAGDLTILSIATVIYSTLHVPATKLEDDPFGQFAWLRAKLAEAVQQGRSVWIIGHISPGIETFGFTELWWPAYVDKYLAIVQDPQLGPAIAAQLFGHVHKDEIRVLPDPPPGAGPIFLSSSISPVYYNNPSFKIVQYNRTTGKLLSFKVIYSEVPADGKPLQWKFGYDLLQTFPSLRSLGGTMAAEADLAAALLEGGETWKKYAKWYATNYPSDLQHYTSLTTDSVANATWKLQRRKQYVCATVVRTAAAYQDCLGILGVSPTTLAAPAVTDEIERLVLGRLLSWAYLSDQAAAKVVLKLAAQAEWGKLLALFGDLVESSLHSGRPLDTIMAD